MAALSRAYGALLLALVVIAGAMVVVVFVLIVTDVTMRTLGFDPPLFTIAVVEYSLLYFSVLAAPYLVRQKAHVFIDALTSRFPPALRRVVEKAVYALSIAATLAFAVLSLDLLIDAIDSGALDERGIYVPLWLMYAPLPGVFLLVAVEFARFLIGIDSFYADRGDVQDNV